MAPKPRPDRRLYSLTGVDEAVRNIDLIVAAKLEAVGLATEAQARIVLARSQQLVPIDTGALFASGRVDTKIPGPPAPGRIVRTGRFARGLTGARVSYGNAQVGYALYVHERTDVHHPIGQAKFLEQAIKERVRHYGPALAKAARNARPRL